MLEYKCKVCGFRGRIRADHYMHGTGCSACNGKSVLIGFNDVATTDPDVARFIYPAEDSHKYTRKSAKHVGVMCDVCGYKRDIKVCQLTQDGFNCPICGDGISYPNRFMHALLINLGVDCVPEYRAPWSGLYRYDFFLPQHNSIIEMHGMQHYIKRSSFSSTLKEIRERDSKKRELALGNGVQYYFEIPAKRSNAACLMDSIKSSGVFEKLQVDTTNLSLSEVALTSSNSVSRKCLYEWQSGESSTSEIAEKLGVSSNTVRSYLKAFASMGLCDYDPARSIEMCRISAVEAHKRKVMCVNTGLQYSSIREASMATGVSERNIVECVRGRNASAGKSPSGEKYIWTYAI